MARDFNGSSDITYTLTASQTSLTTLTIASWLYPDNVGQYRRHIHLGNGFPNGQYRVEFDDGWGWVFNAKWTTNGGSWSISKPSTGAWIHHVVTYDGGATTNDPIIYTNGTSQTVTERSTPSGTLENTATNLTIGSEASTGQYWDGRMAEIAIWNRVLSASEVSGLGKGLSPLFYPRGLVFYIPLQGRVSTEPDLMRGVAGSVDAGVTAIEHPRIFYPNMDFIRKVATGGGVATAIKDIISMGFMAYPR